jgi:hypothetical protein
MNIKYKQLLFISIIIIILLLIRNIIINSSNNIEHFENKDNITLEIQSHGGGFFSNFNKIFETYDDGNESTKIIRTDNYVDYSITMQNAYNYYNENRNKLQPYHDTYKKYIKIHSHIQDKIDRKLIELKENCDQLICIFVRSDALHKEQPSLRMPTREEYDSAIERIPKSDKVKYFLCIDNNDDLEYYKNKYYPNYYTSIRRTKNVTDGEPHVNSMGSLEELENSFIEVVLMSNCDILVHCVSNMATASLYMNMKQQSICVA